MTETKNTQTTDIFRLYEIVDTIGNYFGYRIGSISAYALMNNICSIDDDFNRIAHHCGIVWLYEKVTHSKKTKQTLLNVSTRDFKKIFSTDISAQELIKIKQYVSNNGKIVDRALVKALSLIVGNYIVSNNEQADHFNENYLVGNTSTVPLGYDVTLKEAFWYFAINELIEKKNPNSNNNNNSKTVDNNETNNNDQQNNSNNDENDEDNTFTETIINDVSFLKRYIKNALSSFKTKNQTIRPNTFSSNNVRDYFGSKGNSYIETKDSFHTKTIPIEKFDQKLSKFFNTELKRIFENHFIEKNSLNVRSLFEAECERYSWVPDRRYNTFFDENDIIVETEREIFDFHNLNILVVIDISGSVEEFIPAFGTLYNSLPPWINKNVMTFDDKEHLDVKIKDKKLISPASYGGTRWHSAQRGIHQFIEQEKNKGKTIDGIIVITDCDFEFDCYSVIDRMASFAKQRSIEDKKVIFLVEQSAFCRVLEQMSYNDNNLYMYDLNRVRRYYKDCP